MHVTDPLQPSPENERECSIGLVLGRLFGLFVVAVALALPASASASPVLVMGAGGHVHRANDRYLPTLAVTPPPAASAARAPRAVRPKKPQKTVTSELARLYRSRQI